MDYTQLAINTQFENTVIDDGYLKIPNTLSGFVNTHTEIEDDPKKEGYKIIVYKGVQTVYRQDKTCDCCGAHMYKNMICAPTRLSISVTVQQVQLRKSVLVRCSVQIPIVILLK